MLHMRACAPALPCAHMPPFAAQTASAICSPTHGWHRKIQAPAALQCHTLGRSSHASTHSTAFCGRGCASGSLRAQAPAAADSSSLAVEVDVGVDGELDQFSRCASCTCMGTHMWL